MNDDRAQPDHHDLVALAADTRDAAHQAECQQGAGKQVKDNGKQTGQDRRHGGIMT